MKIGKETIFALLECACFIVGAVFFVYVFIDISNPLWALWMGLIFATAGILMWLVPLMFKLIKKIWTRQHAGNRPIELATDTTDTSYELHRPTEIMTPTDLADPETPDSTLE